MTSERHHEQRRRGARKGSAASDARDDFDARTSGRHATRKAKRLRHTQKQDRSDGPWISWSDTDDDEIP